MAHKDVMRFYYSDIKNLTDLLNQLVNSYRLLIGGAGELNTIALATKNEVKDAIKRACELGEIIDEVIKAIDKESDGYFEYSILKGQIIKYKIEENIIRTEIEDELQFNNSERDPE
ncbi:MAG: hypothetical protein Q8900_13465 [Bacillota bacterium]|nr:hypothetical protein [Bacillota bacterium]